MTRVEVDFPTIDLDNCNREPIHIPGQIQPHGILVAFHLQGTLTHASSNAGAVLASLPVLGAAMPPQYAGTDAPLWVAVGTALSDAATEQERAPLNLELESGGAVFDAVLLAHDGQVIVELEQRATAVVDLAPSRCWRTEAWDSCAIARTSPRCSPKRSARSAG